MKWLRSLRMMFSLAIPRRCLKRGGLELLDGAETFGWEAIKVTTPETQRLTVAGKILKGESVAFVRDVGFDIGFDEVLLHGE